MISTAKLTTERTLGPLKNVFKKQFKSFGGDRLVPLIQVLGFQWIPEIILRGQVDSLLSVGGSFVTTFTFLAAVQVFGMKGLVHWGMLQGAGMTAGALVVLTDSDKEGK